MPYLDIKTRDGYTPFMLAAFKNLPVLIHRLSTHSHLYESDSGGLNALHLAASKGSLKAVKKLRDFPIHMDGNVGSSNNGKSNEHGLTALHFAASSGHYEVYRALIDFGADVNIIGSQGSTVMDAMVESNSEIMYAALIKLPQFYEPVYQQKLLITAAKFNNMNILRQLYILGVKLDAYDKQGLTALHYAVINGHWEAANFLLKSGVSAHVPTTDPKPRSALDLAKELGRSHIVKLVESYMGRTVLPAFPPSLCAKTIEEIPQVLADEALPNIYHNKEMSRVEHLFVHEKTGCRSNSALHLLAIRIKNELGIGILRMLMEGESSKENAALLSETMNLMLEIGDASKAREAWKIQPVKACNKRLKKIYNEMMATKYPEVSPSELANRFATKSESIEYPLALTETEEMAVKYRQILKSAEAIEHMDISELVRKAQKEKDHLKLVAIIRQSIIKTFKICPYNTQIFAMLGLTNQIAGYKGRIGQIKTGEGKSTIIAMIAALYALEGRTVDIITTSHSLAERDHAKYAPFYSELGLTSTNIYVSHPDQSRFKDKIIYGVNTDFEFALLRQQLNGDTARFAHGQERPMDVAIIDEADSFFLDLALSATRIATSSSLDCNWVYKPYLQWIKTHDKFDLKEVTQLLQNVSDGRVLPSDDELEELFATGKRALSYNEGIQYIVRKDKIVIVDHDNTGRLNKGSRWNSGLHAFVKAKHNLPIKNATLTAASISHVAFFRQYKRIIGLTGTIGENQERIEVRTLYDLDIFDVPSHMPNKNITLEPTICSNESEWHKAMITKIGEMLVLKRPVLVLLSTIRDSTKFASRLRTKGINHHILNAVQQEEEDYILVNSGQAGAVTIATNTAGRGTDIILSAEAKKNGGLHVILGAFSKNSRVKTQGKGRAARQGQEGSNEMIINMQDPAVQSLLESNKFFSCPFIYVVKVLKVFRNLEVEKLSNQRMKAAELSIVSYSIFSHFMKIKSNVESGLERIDAQDINKASLKAHILESWGQFYQFLDKSATSKDAMINCYNRFLDNSIKPIFVDSIADLQNLITRPIYLDCSISSSRFDIEYL